MTLASLLSTWRTRADELEPYTPAAAAAFRTAAEELEAALRDTADEELTLAQAVQESGFSDRTLRERIASGAIPNAGRKHAPRIRRGDLPKRARGSTARWDPDAHVRDIVGGAR